MTQRRFLFVNGFLVLFGCAHLLIIVSDRQQEKQAEWPLLYYPMFSRLKHWTFRKHLLVGIERDPPHRELPLLKPEYLRPLHPRDVHHIAQMFGPRKDGRVLLRAALSDIFHRYERRRQRNVHDGPPLRALRLYRQRWRASPGFVPAHPESHVVLAEFPPP